MNAVDATMAPAVARTDHSGRLVSADARLLDLNARAGGAVGAPFAVPELATLVRLAGRLAIAVGRDVTVADGTDDLDLWVRADPADDGVLVEVGGWHARPAWRGPTPGADDAGFLASEGDFAWETDATLRFTHLPLDTAARFGFDGAALLGQPLLRLFTLAPGLDGDLPILGAVAAQMRFDGQLAELRGTGQQVRLAATPRIDERGRFAGLFGTARLIDGDALPDAPVLAPAPAIPPEFGARLDRALRRPLERIVANADSMSAEIEGPLAAGYAGYASDIASAGRHLLGLVGDLADLEAIERDDFATAREPIDLADVARRAAGLLALRASDTGVLIDKPALDDVLPATGEFGRTLQVLVNLIGNAVRYSPSGGTVWIRGERDGDAACIIVADQGKGIAPADHARIFDKFTRVDSDEPGGSGLGLYIARRLARAMGGDITVDSAAGQGARFILRLPARS